MRGFAFLLLSFLVTLQLQAQQDQHYSLEALELLSLDSLELRNPIDTLIQLVDNYRGKLSGLKEDLNATADLPDTLLQHNPLDKINQKPEDAQQKVNAVADSLKQKLQLNLPDSLKNLAPKELGLLPDVEIPDLEIKPLEELKGINEIDKIAPLKKIDHIISPVEIETLPELEQAGVITDKLNEVKAEVVSQEKMGESVENEAKNLKGIKALEEQKGEFEGAIPDIDQLKDSEHYKEELANKVKEKAVNHFAGHGDKLQAAQNKLADIKKKYPEGVSSIKNLPKRRTNPMKGKPFKERLIWGLTVQIHPDEIPNIDVSPFTAFKVSQRISLGIGGSYRLMTKDDFKGITSEGAVYGYRGVTEILLQKGIFVHAEYEILKTLVRDSIFMQISENFLEKKWVDGLLVGIGKEYKIGGFIKGNMQVLYNMLHEANSPYQDRVMVRFGFSFQSNEKVKKHDIKPEIERAKTYWKKSKPGVGKLKTS